jgi:hypothetical protein
MEAERGLVGLELIDRKAITPDYIIYKHKIGAGLVVVPF